MFFIALFSLNINAENTDPTDYPYQDSEKGEVDQWAFYTRYCTSYAAYRADEILGDFHNTMTGPNEESGRFGNADNWDNNAEDIGFTVTTTPTVGSIVNWEANDGGSGSVGHVAYVESVIDTDSFTISEYNWNSGDGNYNSRTVNISAVNNPSFIVLSDDIPCTPPASGEWTIDNDCSFAEEVNPPDNVIIVNDSTVTIENGGALNIDFLQNKLIVESGSKILINGNGKIY